MSVKGKSGSAKNYYGSIAGVVCGGPVDELISLIVDSKTVWPTDVGFADDIVDLPVIAYQRQSNVAKIWFSVPHKLHHNQKFILTGMTDSSFDESSPTTISNNDDYSIKFANTGSNVAKTDTASGLLTKIVHYIPGDVVRYAGSVWTSIGTFDGTPDKAPPNATYWTEYSVKRVDNPTDFSFAVADSNQTYGSAVALWGTDSQTLSDILFLSQNGHPPYRHQFLLALKDWFFGTEREGPQNVEVIVRRTPVQSVITGDAADLDSEGQANPMAALAELITDPIYGIGLDSSLLDATSWQAVADDLLADSDKTYFSPMLDNGDTLRSLISQILAYFDGWLRFNADGKIEAGRFLHNESPPSFDDSNTIDFHDCVKDKEIAWDATSYADTYNEIVCKFTDKDRAFKDAAQLFSSGFNRQVTGEPRRQTLDRPWIMRETQANGYAAEWGKIYAQPKLGGSLTVRAEKAAAIAQGTVFRLTHDAISLSIVCRCVEKTFAAVPVGEVTLRFESERGVAPIPYSPTGANKGGTGLSHPEPISLYQLFQPPPALVGDQDFHLMILAARTSNFTRGLRPWMKADDTSLFYQLGEQRTFGVKGVLHQDYAFPSEHATEERGRASNVATIKITAHGYASEMRVNVTGMGGTGYDADDVTITVTDASHFTYANTGSNEGTTADTGGTVTPTDDDDSQTLQIDFDEFTLQPDLDRISATQTDDAVNDNAVLVFLFDASDPTQFEVATLKEITLDSGVYKLKVRRERFSTVGLSFVTNDLAWIIYRDDLVSYTHAKFAEYAQSATSATFRLQAFTVNEEADLSDSDVCPDISFDFADPYAPTMDWKSLQVNGADISSFTTAYLPTDVFSFGFEVSDPNSDLVKAELTAELGSEIKTLWSQTFEATALRLVSTSFSLTDGVWRIFCTVTDATGRTVRRELFPVGGGSPVQLIIQTSSSTVTCTPIASPPGETYPSSQSVTLTCSTAGSTIHYSKVAYGAAPGSYSTYSGPINIPLTGRTSKYSLYAYASKAGLTDSPVVRNDYAWESNL